MLLVSDLVPRITTRAEPPAPTADELMVTPATLPTIEFMKLASLTVVISSDLTCCTLYDSAFSSRLIPMAVTTTALRAVASSWSVTSSIV